MTQKSGALLFLALFSALLSISSFESAVWASALEPTIIRSDTTFLPEHALKRINCRVGRKTADGGFEIYQDVELNTISENAKDYAFETLLPNGKKLGIMLKHLNSLHPADQFSVRAFLDRQSFFKVSRMDLEIYFEFTIDPGPLYLLHCFPPID